MKPHVITSSMVAAIGLAAFSSFAADSLPKAPAFARYEPMMNRSPFAVATAAAPMPAATPNFAKDLYIANAARTPDGDLVTIASTTDKNLKEYASTKAPSKGGYSISNIDWSDRVGATTVTISKDGQFATLTFNQALISQPVATAVPGQPQPQVPIQSQLQMQQPSQAQVQQITPQASTIPAQPTFQQQPSIARPATGIPNLPTPPPRVRGTIPRNPGQPAVPQPTPAQPQGQQPVVPDE